MKVKSTDQGVIVIAGDLFEKFEDLKDDSIWKEAGSEDPELQAKNRGKSLENSRFCHTWPWRHVSCLKVYVIKRFIIFLWDFPISRKKACFVNVIRKFCNIFNIYV